MLLPPRGFIHDYLTTYIHGTTPGLTCAPDTYHLLVALSVLSTVVADKVVVRGEGRPSRPLIYGLLVGDSGAGKTTAINYGMDLVRAIPEFHDRVAPSDTSAEGLVQFLIDRNQQPKTVTLVRERAGTEQAPRNKPGEANLTSRPPTNASHPASKEPLPPVILVWEEFGDFLAVAAPNAWGARLRILLMALHDQPKTRLVQRASRSTASLHDPFVGVLAGVNMTLLNEQKTAEVDWTGGFLPRFLPLACGKVEGEAEIALHNVNPKIRHPAPQDEATVLRLAEQLQAIRETAHPIDGLTPAAKSTLDAWWDKHDERKRTYLLESTWQRLPTHVPRIAALYTLDMAPDAVLITEEAIVYACSLADAVWNTTCLMVQTTATTPIRQMQERLLDRVREMRDLGVRKRDLLRYSHLLTADFDKHLKTLQEAGHVRVRPVKIRGQTVEYVCLEEENTEAEADDVLLLPDGERG